ALAGGGDFGFDEEGYFYINALGSVVAYDLENGAGETLYELTGWYMYPPQIAVRGRNIYLYDPMDQSVERISSKGSAILHPLPDYLMPGWEGCMLSCDEGILMVGVPSEDGSSDTWIMRDGTAKFVPLIRKMTEYTAFGVAAAEHNGRVYAIGTAAREKDFRFFRANDVATLNKPIPVADVSAVYNDVKKDAWYYDAVGWAVNEGIMNGVGDDTFDPGGTCTRAMAVTMLWRLAWRPEAEDAGFADVAEGAWYEQAVNWAFVAGIVTGKSEDTFAPDDPVTREQLAAILYRYAHYRSMSFEGISPFPLDYTDAGDISGYAEEALCWMTKNGVINGMGDGTLAPGAYAARAQIAAIFMRFAQALEQ
ncbi:MAG: S-layer homology domain-containing protein, partial [Oscillospiraceae bacterium]|nr:S-layer homology domain-containing protein [Oscillospiraceae bacterium]